jgi:hypothetical protein
MKEHFNPFSLANTLLMSRSHYRGSYLLVEGETDVRFFLNLTKDEICKILDVHGKDNVIDTIKELDKRKGEGFLGIVDADFWVLEGIKPIDNLLYTDTHDIETMIILSPALEKVLKEFLPGDKLDCIQKLCIDVRQVLLQIGLPIGCLRWISHKERLELDFDVPSFDPFVNPQKLSVDNSEMIRCIIRVNTKKRITMSDSDFENKLNELMKLKEDPWHVCQGHDLVCILKIILPVVLDKLVDHQKLESIQRKLYQSDLDRNLRLAYEPQYFVETKLYISIRNWESLNEPYRILPQNRYNF